MNSARLFVGEPKMADFADDVALLSGNGCCRVDRIACAGVENRGKKRNSTKRCGLDRLNLIYAKRAVARPPNGLIRYPRLKGEDFTGWMSMELGEPSIEAGVAGVEEVT
jgi:hypothetical protein